MIPSASELYPFQRGFLSFRWAVTVTSPWSSSLIISGVSRLARRGAQGPVVERSVKSQAQDCEMLHNALISNFRSNNNVQHFHTLRHVNQL